MSLLATLQIAFALLASEPVQATAFVQSEEHFAAAINDESNHQYYVLVTVTDGRAGITKTGCVDADFLIGAIHREQGLGYDASSNARALDFALSSRDHRFVFRNPDALRNVDFDRFGSANKDVCAAIRSGQLAYRPHNQPWAVAIDTRFSRR